MKKFLKDLEKELKKLKINSKDIEEILEDHKEMIEAAKSEGLNDEQLEEKFGNPVNVAKDIFEDNNTLPKEGYNFEDIDSCVKENTADYTLVKTFPIVSEEITIEISLISDDLSLIEYDGESIQVYEKEIKDIKEYTITLDDNHFELKKDKNKFKLFSSSSNDARFFVLIPKGVKIKDFEYKTISGDLELDGITALKFKLKSTSGDVETTNLDLGETKFSTISGDIEINNLKAKSFEMSLISGDLDIKKAIIEEDMYFNSVSGDVQLYEVECNNATLKTVSGDLNGNEFYPKEVILKSISGDINIDNRDVLKEVNIIVKKTISGEINIK